jgi:hypothetical protein
LLSTRQRKNGGKRSPFLIAKFVLDPAEWPNEFPSAKFSGASKFGAFAAVKAVEAKALKVVPSRQQTPVSNFDRCRCFFRLQSRAPHQRAPISPWRICNRWACEAGAHVRAQHIQHNRSGVVPANHR